MAKWIVSGSAETTELPSGWGTVRLKINATHFNVEVDATTAGSAHDLVVKSLEQAGWSNVNLSGINQEV